MQCHNNGVKCRLVPMDHLSKERISNLVKEGRAAKGYTQQELSDLTRISLRSVQRIENAEVAPRMYTLKLLAEQLDFVNELYEQRGAVKAKDELSTHKPGLNKPRKLILTISSGLLIILFSAAFLSQSVKFPETTFELFIFLSIVAIIYALVLFKIWGK